MNARVLRPIITRHPREQFPTPESVADHFGVPREAIDCHTFNVDGFPSEWIFVSWRAGTIFPEGVRVYINF
ncbi:MAG: hypothetical protein KF800_00490 [Lysobacter sp.]|nr:hypothetical protein [Lysobacter sp.]